MSISNEVVKHIYTGNGSVVDFAIPFTVLYSASAETRVVLRDETVPTAITETLWAEGVDYTLTGAPIDNVRATTAPTATQKLLVKRRLNLTQLVDFLVSAKFPVDSNELQLDNAVALAQQIDELSDRSLKLAETDLGTFDPTMPNDILAGYYLAVNGTGNGWVLVPNTVGDIVNADISASAAIEFSKMENLTASKALVSDGNGDVSAATATSAEVDFLVGVTSSVVSEDNTQTLTNKTLTAPVVNSPTGIVKGDVGLGNVDNTSNATERAAVATLTNKTLTSAILNTAVSGTAVLDEDTMSSDSATQIATQQSIKAYVDATASGFVDASAGMINYMSGDNYNFESGVGGWVAYADAAGASPVDGTGGSPVVTMASVVGSLRGTKVGRLAKNGTNRQGDGVSRAFVIEDADFSRQMEVSYDYTTDSPTATGDVFPFIYDIDGAALVTLTSWVDDGSTFRGTFTTDGSSNNYRMILHCATTTASSYDYDFDTVVVRPLHTSSVPTVQKFTSGSGTYTTPLGCAAIRVRLTGGGGGGSGSGTASAGTGGTGVTSTFGTSLLSSTGGGGGGGIVGIGLSAGAGGAASLGSGPQGLAVQGSGGSCGVFTSITTTYPGGGAGGASALGGGGQAPGPGVGPGGGGAANTGGGGAGGSGGSTVSSGQGGGSAGFVDAIIVNPNTSYAYAVGAGGAAGGAGTSGSAGGAGGSGIIIVEEYY